MFEYTDTEFRFIEYHRKYGYLPLESQNFERLYRLVIDQKVVKCVEVNSSLTPSKRNEIELKEVNEAYRYLKEAYQKDLEEYEKVKDQIKIQALSQFYEPILLFLTMQKVQLQGVTDTEAVLGSDRPRLKWLAGPAYLAHVITMLIDSGYVEPPKHDGKETTNLTALSKLCLEIFELQTTPGNLRKELDSNRNTVPVSNKRKFQIPPQQLL